MLTFLSRFHGLPGWSHRRIDLPTSILMLIAFLGGAGVTSAQDSRPVGFHQHSFAIVGARLFTGEGDSIPAGTIICRDGLITAVGEDVNVPADATTIDGSGLVVYPGFIDAASTQLLSEKVGPQDEAARTVDYERYALAATRPDNRRGISPDFDVSSALDLSKESLDKLRQTGFTSVHVLRTAPIIGGRSCLVSLSGAPLREAVQKRDVFTTIRLHAPERDAASSDASRYPTTLMGAFAHLRQALLDAQQQTRHQEAWAAGLDVSRPPADAVLESLVEVQSGRQPALLLANSSDDHDAAVRALRFREELEFTSRLLASTVAWDRLEELSKLRDGLLLALDFGEKPKVELPKTDEKLQAEVKPPVRYQQSRLDDWSERVALARRLREAGVPVAFSSLDVPEKSTLLSQVQALVEAGLSADDALAGLTIEPAKVLGVEDRLGTLEPGKLAHLVVMSGLFESKKSKVRYVFVDGERFEYNEPKKSDDSDSHDESEPIDLAGNWVLTIETGPMKSTAATIRLKPEGSDLSGEFSSEQGDGQIVEGRIDGRTLTFKVAIGAGAQSIELTFDGQALVEDDVVRLEGELKSPFGSPAPWSAHRENDTLADKDTRPEQGETETTGKSSTTEKESPEVAAKTDELPTELRSDRIRRPIETGGSLLITNGTILLGTGKTLEGGSILVRDGKIAEIGQHLNAEGDITTIDATGRFVMPGMIDTHSHIMIQGGGNEGSLSIVPEVRIKDALETVDDAEYRALAGGLTTARNSARFRQCYRRAARGRQTEAWCNDRGASDCRCTSRCEVRAG